MPEVEIKIGGAPLKSFVRMARKHYLHSAPRCLDTESVGLLAGQIGRLARSAHAVDGRADCGLIRTAGLEDKAAQRSRPKLPQKMRELGQMAARPAPAAAKESEVAVIRRNCWKACRNWLPRGDRWPMRARTRSVRETVRSRVGVFCRIGIRQQKRPRRGLLPCRSCQKRSACGFTDLFGGRPCHSDFRFASKQLVQLA